MAVYIDMLRHDDEAARRMHPDLLPGDAAHRNDDLKAPLLFGRAALPLRRRGLRRCRLRRRGLRRHCFRGKLSRGPGSCGREGLHLHVQRRGSSGVQGYMVAGLQGAEV